ncbi:MAG: type II toxin-antitoxin system VapC family toxin [Kiritimatiellae bacterium]|nr:type II toxin-antitoxin system VapC family toxin [Kiritimatiellia bacterium]
MSWLLDTCVVSELGRKRPDRRVLRWMRDAQDDLQFLSVLTLGELRKGAAKAADPARREAIRRWIDEEIAVTFSDAILPVDLAVAERWGSLCGEAERRGRPRPAIDALLAATALVHGLTLVTRNVSDVEWTGVLVFNPFD